MLIPAGFPHNQVHGGLSAQEFDRQSLTTGRRFISRACPAVLPVPQRHSYHRRPLRISPVSPVLAAARSAGVPWIA